jgi:hypothetical protein
MVLEKQEVENKLAALIVEGKVSCFKCGEHLNGSDIVGFDLAATDGKPKVFYLCPNTYCARHTVQGFRTLAALGIAEVIAVDADSPLKNVTAPVRPAESDFLEEEGDEDTMDRDGDDDEPEDAPEGMDEEQAL